VDSGQGQVYHQVRQGGQMKKEAVKEPAPDFGEVKKLPKNFAELVRERREIAQMIGELEDRKNEITEILVPAFMAAGKSRIAVDGVAAVLVQGTSSKIDGRKLLEKGVPSTVIQYATVVATYQYINPGRVKEDGGDSFTE
jgi:hypothetical protein